MTMLDTMQEAQTRSLEQMRSMQEELAAFNERIADSMLSTLPEMDSPFAEYMPKPTEMVENYFSFLGELHTANKAFASRMASAWERAEDVEAPAKKK